MQTLDAAVKEVFPSDKSRSHISSSALYAPSTHVATITIQAMPSKSNVIVTIGSVHNLPTSAKLTPRILQKCPQLAALPAGSSLPNIHPKPFQIILAYLDGDESLSVFIGCFKSSIFLLRFAQTWALAARLCLPVLQNKFVALMRNVYGYYVESRSNGQYPVNQYLFEAFQHLRKEFGPNSHAEDFLCCFVGRTAPLICELERQLNDVRFDQCVKEKMLAEARSFDKDPIKYQPQRFMVSLRNPPKYPPLDVQSAHLPNELMQHHDPRRTSDVSPGSQNDNQEQEATTLSLQGPKASPLGQQGELVVGHGQSPALRGSEPIVYGNEIYYDAVENVCGNTPDQPGGSLGPDRKSNDHALYYGSRSYLPPRLRLPSECKGKAPYTIQILQPNDNANNNTNYNGNRIKNENAATVLQGRGGKGKRSKHIDKVVREKKGKRFAWFSLLICGSHDY
jgi:hypothetical protein